jgi:hypothetical protein
MKKLLFVIGILASCYVCGFADPIKVETVTKFDYTSGIYCDVIIATCPICGVVNKDYVRRYITEDDVFCPHYIDRGRYFVFDYTDKEKTDLKIKKLEDENEYIKKQLKELGI